MTGAAYRTPSPGLLSFLTGESHQASRREADFRRKRRDRHDGRGSQNAVPRPVHPEHCPRPRLAENASRSRRGTRAEGAVTRTLRSATGNRRFPVELSGEGGIRTLEGGVDPLNALAGRRLQPLGHFSERAQDSELNPRLLASDSSQRPPQPIRAAAAHQTPFPGRICLSPSEVTMPPGVRRTSDGSGAADMRGCGPASAIPRPLHYEH
jgi:hypothetical protein